MGKTVFTGAKKDCVCKAMNAVSSFTHDSCDKVAATYESIVREVLCCD